VNPAVPVVPIHHGTTARRATAILNSGPDAKYVEPGGSFHDPAGGFSTSEANQPDLGLLTPEDYARMKAGNFPAEGGPVILEVEVPEWIVDIVRNHPELGLSAATGEIRFEPGAGLEELQQAWPTLDKRILPL
jgi:hypothetical protein